MLAEAQQARLGANEAFFREVNERIEEVGVRFAGSREDEFEFVCECPEPNCVERVRLTVGEYEAIRSSPRRFVVAPGHQVDEIEHVVVADAESTVVEKDGVAGEVAAGLDPRG